MNKRMWCGSFIGAINKNLGLGGQRRDSDIHLQIAVSPECIPRYPGILIRGAAVPDHEECYTEYKDIHKIFHNIDSLHSFSFRCTKG